MNRRLLTSALAELAGVARDGDLVYVRCLTRQEIENVLRTAPGGLGDWKLRGVGAPDGPQWLAADQAVEVREEKGPATILLVDLKAAGAGMDGIYTASREIFERALFEEALKAARNELPAELRQLAQQAMQVARRMGGRRNQIPQRQELDFYGALLSNPEDAGRLLHHLGLWPIAGDSGEAGSLLRQSGQMVERLFLAPATQQAPAVRISNLTLTGISTDARKALEELVRHAGAGWREDTLREIAKNEHLWLGNLRPGLLAGNLLGIELVPWRSAGAARLLQWSGLTQGADDELPKFVVDRDNPHCKLEVRWKVTPDHLAKGAASFELRVLAGDEVISSRHAEHCGRSLQKLVFDPDDFQDLDETSQFEACIEVLVPDAPEVAPLRTEDFRLFLGQTPPTARVTSGEIVHCPADALIHSESLGTVEAFLEERKSGQQGQMDRHGYLAFRIPDGGRAFRVERPAMLSKIESDWAVRARSGPIGRWVVRCRPDGSWAGDPEFRAIETTGCSEAESQRLVEVTRKFCEDAAPSGGTLSLTYLHSHSTSRMFSDYINAWQVAIEKCPPAIALANTLEVESMSGATLGLVVLPFHAIRLAWQNGYDTLALHMRYSDDLAAARIRKALSWLDGAYYPFVLPGLQPGETFVFGDVLGHAGAVLVRDSDKEPKATIATISVCYVGAPERIEPSLSGSASGALAREVRNYLDTHPGYRFLNVHAIRPGDGLTVVRALGEGLQASEPPEEDDSAAKLRDVAVRLDLHPSDGQSANTGRHLVRLNQRRRSGTAAPPPEDAWCLESLTVEGGRTLPRLRWARRELGSALSPAHLAIAFDMFTSRVKATEKDDGESPLIAFGLAASLRRSFRFEDGYPRWLLSIPSAYSGEKLPTRIVTERLTRLHTLLLEATARHHGQAGKWPTLLTEPSGDDIEFLARLHELCDWVVTIDRNVGVEYFDSPHDAEGVFEAYVIDAVPERDDLGCLQLITSTAHLDEVRHLLDHTLTLMGLSGSARNCAFLLGQLKALSGRLAMRLASSAPPESAGRVGAELVALALARKRCLDAAEGDPCWMPLQQGFFVPLDDVRDLVPETCGDTVVTDTEPADNQRADLLFVSIPARGRLGLQFLEVKYRRHLSVARSTDLLESIGQQTDTTRRRWIDWFFDPAASAPERSLRAARLTRVLRFYADKAARHHLAPDVRGRFDEEILRYLTAPAEYELASTGATDRGYIFCPDYGQATAESLGDGGSQQCEIWLFGSDTLPDRASGLGPTEVLGEVSVVPPRAAVATVEVERPPDDNSQPAGTRSVNPTPAAVPERGGGSSSQSVRLGVNRAEEPVSWTPAIDGNPHLMIVGLPGMGKTTCLTNICRQLHQSGITPIVFSYHDDIDERLGEVLEDVARHDCRDLGFNPMRVMRPSPFAHIESAGQIRDIFHAIFPDLGDLQLEQLRGALKQSYQDAGWGGTDAPHEPAFRAFVDILRHSARPDTRTQTLLARMSELEDYHFFDAAQGGASLLDLGKPCLLQVHSVANESVQRAFASFVLYRIYQDMFRRGRQERLTHAVVFDEAHRASRLKLLPTMAKECRKYGLALLVASQEARDFDPSLYAAIANYLALRLTEQDARAVARNVASSDIERRIADRLKSLPRYEALFFSEGQRQPEHIRLDSGS